jgi:amino acid transporter
MFVRKRRRPRGTPAEPAVPRSAPKPITWTALALLTVGSVGNLGSAPPLAVLGLASVFLYVLPALVFLVPVSLVAAELASGWSGGVYNWVSQGISAPMGLLAVWCQFAQTIFFYLLLIGRKQGFLPPYFQQVNRQGIEVRIIATQGVVITLIAVLYAFIPSVSHAFWIFTVLATQVYLIMYVLMFIAAIRLRRSQPDHPGGYRAPALRLLCVLGTVSSVVALVIGFIPPAQFAHSNPLKYTIEILAGILVVGIVPPLLMDRLRRPEWKAAADSTAPESSGAGQ